MVRLLRAVQEEASAQLLHTLGRFPGLLSLDLQYRVAKPREYSERLLGLVFFGFWFCFFS